ncbi:MAG: hypothetical protein IPM50_00095 [Acidobacteriota bacterium]|nr:MAG: hypothetical protein IPM50_00095 [Acidobacteriota bacterium]
MRKKQKMGWRLGLSRALAILLGIAAPVLDTYRRWNTWQDDPLDLFDDYILGGLLLYGAWRVSKDVSAGQEFLVAGWGFALGLVYASVDFELQQVRAGASVPAGIPSEFGSGDQDSRTIACSHWLFDKSYPNFRLEDHPVAKVYSLSGSLRQFVEQSKKISF